MNRKSNASIVFKLLILAAGLLGQAVSLRHASFMTRAHFLYYTNQSNLWTILLALALLGIELHARRQGRPARPPRWLLVLRFAITTGVLLTFVGFSLLLMPRMLNSPYLRSLPNLLVHNLVPLLAGADYVLFDYGDAKRPRSALPGLLMPLFYGVFAFAVSQKGRLFARNSRFPYFFLDYEANGWFTLGGGKLGVFWWALLIALCVYLLGKGLLTLQCWVAKKTSI
ncbi:MAG: Pr6Pr family membrane protein [Christensenellales bacterium]|jgi:hypothetical protein